MKNIKKYLIAATLIPILALSFSAVVKADNNENEHGNNGMGGGEQNRNEHDSEDQMRRATGSTLEVHINNDGKVLVRGAKVTAIAGNVVTATTTFGANVMTWTVNTTDSLHIIRRFGGTSSVSEIQLGDFISFMGMLNTSVSGLTVNAAAIKDWSIQMKNSSFSGTISSIDGAGISFVLASSNRGNITVTTTSTTVLRKGDITIAFADMHVGDKVEKTEGLFDNASSTLKAASVKIHNDASQEARVYEGKIQAVGGTTLPTTLSVMVGSTLYTINVPVGISVLSNNWLITPFTTLQVNDNVRVYGAAQTATPTTIDASVVRDTSR